MAEGGKKAKQRASMAEREQRDGEHEGCQVSGFGSASVHSNPLYLG